MPETEDVEVRTLMIIKRVLSLLSVTKPCSYLNSASCKHVSVIPGIFAELLHLHSVKGISTLSL